MVAVGSNGERYEQRINRAIALIDSRIGEDLRLEALADVACLSPHHFHRIFRSLTGETVHGFTTRLRMERAVGLAKTQPKLAWKEIGARCGYRSASVFSRAFKRHFGIGPAEFSIDAYWQGRPDAEAAHEISRYFLREAPPVPGDFRVEIVRRPAADLAISRAWGSYIDPAGVMAALKRIEEFAAAEGLEMSGGRLAGASRDDPDVTPLSRCRYDFVLELDRPLRLPPGISRGRREEGWWAVTHVDGDMAAVDRAWNLLYKSWLPAAGVKLRDAPCEEVFLKLPAEVGWDRLVLQCCVPVGDP